MQGNLSPALIAESTPEVVAAETKKVLETMRGRPGHIFNLGHGLTPGAKLENIAALGERLQMSAELNWSNELNGNSLAV